MKNDVCRSPECREIALPYNQLARQYRQGVFLRINVADYPEEVQKYNVSAVPTFIFFFCGEERERMTGADQYLLEAKIQQYTQTTHVEQEPEVQDLQRDGSVEDSEEWKDEEMGGDPFDYRKQLLQMRFGTKPHQLGSSSNPNASSDEMRSVRGQFFSKQTSSSLPSEDIPTHISSNPMHGDNEVVEVEAKPVISPENPPIPSLQSIREQLSEMGFSSTVIDTVLKMDTSRDMARLAELATWIVEDSSMTESQLASMSEWERAVGRRKKKNEE